MDQLRENTNAENELIHANAYRLAADPTKPAKFPEIKEPIPFLDFSLLLNALTKLEKSSKKLNSWLDRQNGNLSEKSNQALYQAEQQLLSVNGLPRRPWFKHSIYAPGFIRGMA